MEDGPRVTVVANLIHYKGHEHFLRAWQEVLASYPRGVATLVGDGARRPHLQELTRTLGIEHAVRFVGVRRDVPDLLSNADLYVHPSLQEGSSNAVIEAMAAGKPIVATAVGGSVEAIRDGVTGLLVPPADAPALARAMLQLLADPVAARAMGRRAREAAARQFDVHAMVKAYECTYHRLLASPVGASEQPQTGGAEAS
jgi:glycosyltransferase involved in cell wall biosynthesis